MRRAKTPKDWPAHFTESVQRDHDWCHKCGHRGQGPMVIMHVPFDSEHMTTNKSRGFFRFCSHCIAKWHSMLEAAKDEQAVRAGGVTNGKP